MNARSIHRKPRGFHAGVAHRAAAFLLVLVSAGSAANLPETTLTHAGAEALGGLPGLAVQVDAVSSDARRLGLDEDWMARRVAAAMGRTGVAAIPLADARSDERMPLLVVRLEVTPLPDRAAAAWHLSLGVHRRVRPVEGNETWLARGWEAGAALGVTSHRGLRASVAESLDQQVEELGRAWRARRAAPASPVTR